MDTLGKNFKMIVVSVKNEDSLLYIPQCFAFISPQLQAKGDYAKFTSHVFIISHVSLLTSILRILSMPFDVSVQSPCFFAHELSQDCDTVQVRE